MDDGYRLPLVRWDAEGTSRAVVLAVHGLNDYSNAFASTGHYLAQQGVTVIAYDQRGFGTTYGHGYWHGSERLVKDVRTMTRLLGEHYPDKPLFLLGESMGGAVVLASRSPDPLNIEGIVLVAPAVWSRDSMPLYQRALLWLAAHTVPSRQLTGEGLDLKPSDNIEMLRALGRDPLVIKATRVDVLYGVSNLMDDAIAAPPDLGGHTLILYGENDQIIPKQPTCLWLDQISTNQQPGWNAIIYHDGYHMLTRDLQSDTVLHDIAEWIGNHDKLAPAEDGNNSRERITLFCAP